MPTEQSEHLKKGEDWALPFLAALGETANVRAACKAAMIGRTTAYDRRKADPAFARAWQDSLDNAVDMLELAARQRALQGTLRPVYYKGQRVGTVREYSDTLAIFLLKAHRPAVYRERLELKQTGPEEPGQVLDLSRLTDEQLATLESLLKAAQA